MSHSHNRMNIKHFQTFPFRIFTLSFSYRSLRCHSQPCCSDEAPAEQQACPVMPQASHGGQHRAAAGAGNAPLYTAQPRLST